MAQNEVSFAPAGTHVLELQIRPSVVLPHSPEEKVEEALVFETGRIVLWIGVVVEEHALVVDIVKPLSLVRSEMHLSH